MMRLRILPYLAAALLAAPHVSRGFPTWAGTYPPYTQHDGGNPGTFTLLVNGDASTLRAALLYRVNGGLWNSMHMNKSGLVDGNSLWLISPDTPFDEGSLIEYFFKVYDTIEPGAMIMAGSYENPYAFTAQAGPTLEWYGAVHHWPPDEQLQPGSDVWINMETWPQLAARSADVVFTSDGGTTWHLVPMSREALGQNDHWYVNIGRFGPGIHVQYAIRIKDWSPNRERWANNRGQDYHAYVSDSGIALSWLGNTLSYPFDASTIPVQGLSVYTESWPQSAGISASVQYALQGNTWRTATMLPAGSAGQNDAWMTQPQGPIPPGTIIYYKVHAVDGLGQVFSEPGSDFHTLEVPSSGMDMDKDWLPDDWEHYWFGTESESPVSDFDGDARFGLPMSQYMEYLLGTDPTTSNDFHDVPLVWDPAIPSAGAQVTISYEPYADETGEVHLAWGWNGWQSPTTQPFKANRRSGRLSSVISIPVEADEINVAVVYASGTWDNNEGLDWLIPIAQPNADMDDDGLPDVWELQVLGTLRHETSDDLDQDGLYLNEEFLYGTSPLSPDTDGDGLTDAYEISMVLNPLSADSNGNGVPDGAEDHDDDGWLTIEEAQEGTDPRNPFVTPLSGHSRPPFKWRHPSRWIRKCIESEFASPPTFDRHYLSSCGGQCCVRYIHDFERERTYRFYDIKETTPVLFRVSGNGPFSLLSTDAQLEFVGEADGARFYTATISPGSCTPTFYEKLTFIGKTSSGSGATLWPDIEYEGPLTLDIAVKDLLPSKELSPGRILGLNHDDDDQDGIPDCADDEIPYGDDDLVEIRLSHPPGFPVEISYDPSVIRVYENTRKTLWHSHYKDWRLDAEISQGSGLREYKGHDDLVLYVEAYGPGTCLLKMTDTLDEHLLSEEVRFTVINPRLVPDANHDRQINDTDIDLATNNLPFRFWINDDDDWGAISEGAADSPGKDGTYGNEFNQPDYGNGFVDGLSDVTDFFPVWLDLEDTLETLSGKDITVRLRQEDNALSMIYSGLTAPQAGQYLTTNRSVYGNSLSDPIDELPITWISSAGTKISSTMLNYIRDDGFKGRRRGVLLLEGRAATQKPLVLEIEIDEQKVRTELPLSISGVEAMFRHLNLRHMVGAAGGEDTRVGEPANYPDDLVSDTDFIWVHGFNVNGYEARGWQAEIFKRLFWSGFRARFHGISWFGNQTDIGKTALNYHINVRNADQAGELLSSYVNSLAGPVVVAGHSMGNLVLSFGIQDHGMQVDKYFLVNAAAALEAYDPAIRNDTNLGWNAMMHCRWRVNDDPLMPPEYSNRLWASDWHQLFPADDARSKLTWANRFSSIAHVGYNFYSTGEDVVENFTGENGCFFAKEGGFSRGAWVKQEKLKGRTDINALGSNIGGWGFNIKYEADPYQEGFQKPDPLLAENLSDETLRTEPLFHPGYFNTWSDLYDANNGSTFASNNHAEIIGTMIPALTYANAANPCPRFDDVAGENRNFNMNTAAFQSGWPRTKSEWLHSDIKNIAYPHNHKLFDFLILKGNLSP